MRRRASTILIALLIAGCNDGPGEFDPFEVTVIVHGTGSGSGVVSEVEEEIDINCHILAGEPNQPAEATSAGREIFIHNSGGEDIVVKDDGESTTICTISTAESAFVFCDGTTWRGGVVKAT